MTTVIIPTLVDGSGATVPGKVRIRLVSAKGSPRIGWDVEDGSWVVAERLIEIADTPVSVDLISQARIAADASGAATWYEFSVLPAGHSRPEAYLVQVPESATPVPLADLIGAAAIPPGDVLAGRLLPDASAVPDGWGIAAQAGMPVWIEPTGTDIDPDLSLVYSIAKL